MEKQLQNNEWLEKKRLEERNKLLPNKIVYILQKEGNKKTAKEIAEKYEINISRIYYYAREYNISLKKPKPWNKGRKRHVDILKGKSYKFIEGYSIVRIPLESPFYPMSNGGLIQEHRLIMAKHLGRCLEPLEIIHHKNKIRDDNRIENLEIIKPNEHSIFHGQINTLNTEIKKLRELLLIMLVCFPRKNEIGFIT